MLGFNCVFPFISLGLQHSRHHGLAPKATFSHFRTLPSFLGSLQWKGALSDVKILIMQKLSGLKLNCEKGMQCKFFFLSVPKMTGHTLLVWVCKFSKKNHTINTFFRERIISILYVQRSVSFCKRGPCLVLAPPASFIRSCLRQIGGVWVVDFDTWGQGVFKFSPQVHFG